MRVLKFILESSRPFWLYISGIAFAMCIIAADKNIKPYLIKTIIDFVSLSDYHSIWIAVLIYALAQAAIVWAWSFCDLNTSKYSPQLTSRITQIFLEKISLHPYRFFQNNLSGNIAFKVSNAGQYIPSIINTILIELFQISIMLIISIILLSKVHYGFGLAIILWVFIFIIIGYIAMKKASRLSSTEAESDAKIGGGIIDYISNIFTVKIFSSFNYEQNKIDTTLKEFIHNSINKHLFLRSYFLIQGIIFSIYIMLCIFSMIYLSKNKLITAGDFALILMINFEIVNWLFNLTSIIKNFITQWGAVDQALLILDVSCEIQDKPDAKELNITNGLIVFDKIQFSYKGGKPLFENKSVTIMPGEKVGLVGYSGGGKTTFATLLLRINDVTEGRILIDGQDVRDVTQNSLRQAIGMIPQDPTLFHRSLMDNIRYGNLDATNEEVINAAKHAHSHEFITNLEYGYDTQVGERGVKLSGGQRQRIAIARAFLKNAPILILDEATSQLDYITEGYIQESLRELMHNKTTIVIAHRLSTLLHMDRILVFDQGKIVEEGTHEALVKQNGLYRSLWNAQVNGFLPEKKEPL
jgi:ATP-binding cassette subfamily B protein